MARGCAVQNKRAQRNTCILPCSAVAVGTRWRRRRRLAAAHRSAICLSLAAAFASRTAARRLHFNSTIIPSFIINNIAFHSITRANRGRAYMLALAYRKRGTSSRHGSRRCVCVAYQRCGRRGALSGAATAAATTARSQHSTLAGIRCNGRVAGVNGENAAGRPRGWREQQRAAWHNAWRARVTPVLASSARIVVRVGITGQPRHLHNISCVRPFAAYATSFAAARSICYIFDVWRAYGAL